jgi:formate hydrogenlyase subunit 6/NADH:ubiquinone oxidoreductase subunit I
MYYVSVNDFRSLMEKLSNTYEVMVPVKHEKKLFYKKYAGNEEPPVIGEVRASDPLKAFYFQAREKVAFNFEETTGPENKKPLCIVGVKACDLKGFKVQDFVFINDEYKDPFYQENRKENLVISSDCTCAIDTCFCVALGVNPWPEENFDINVSPVKGGYIAEAGSEKGITLIEKNQDLFANLAKTQEQERQENRESVKKAVLKNIKKNGIPSEDRFKGIIDKNYTSGLWEEEANNCVECGACNAICPTCHCFLLYDQKDEKNLERLRIWDSCLIKDFARVAGGANPRERLWMRLRNRFEKKFDFFPKTAGINACTGCGRCVSACPAKIDIRNVLKRLVEHV